MEKYILNLRKEYADIPLSLKELSKNPLKQLKHWLNDAIKEKVVEANIITLATVSRNNRPSIRAVLMKQLNSKGVIFFTNYNSRKAKDLEFNPYAAINIVWREIGRQVNIEGKIKKISQKENERYFKLRTYEAKIAAITSPQSSVIKSREQLDKIFLTNDKIYKNKKIKCPANWGGFILEPNRIEFWHAREKRLHDRFVYLKDKKNWKIIRLAP
ncbi:MAG: pyridoxamine 5'-phosphate oxidase [Oligoflexia bacterium]|nr:pyridoxamine 5'-phosphate oxidase [Oligoflexia bacterium]